MPIPLPNLDDRTYNDLMAEARAMIPHLLPEWTNHNPSDPGMVLIEMFAWLTEMALYQVNIITDQHKVAFLELLNGANWSLGEQDLETAVHQSILALRDQYRAAAASDFEYLARTKWPEGNKIKRVYCLPRHNLAGTNPAAEAPGHVSLIVMFQTGLTETQINGLISSLWQFLNERRLLTVRHHVVLPTYVPVKVLADIYIREDAAATEALAMAAAALQAYFDPLTGGPSAEGWPFGRGVYGSEIYALLNALALVDHVEAVQLIDRHNTTHSVAVKLDRHELVAVDATGLTAIDVYGNRYTI